MVEQGTGAIVKVASVNAFFQRDAPTVDYGAAGAALVSLSKTLSQEFGPVRHPCQRSLPGPVATDLRLSEHGVAETVARATGVDADTARKTIIAGIGGFATGRLTTPEEVATLITFLPSDRAANLTDANYLIDSGPIKQPEARACLHSSPQLIGSGADHAGDERRNPRGVPGTRPWLPTAAQSRVFCAPFGRAHGAFASSK